MKHIVVDLEMNNIRKIQEVMQPSETGATIGDLIDFSAFACV